MVLSLHNKVVDQSGLSNVNSHRHQHGALDLVDRVHGDTVHGGDVVDLRQGLGGNVGGHGCHNLVCVGLSLLRHLLAQEHGLGQDQGGLCSSGFR